MIVTLVAEIALPVELRAGTGVRWEVVSTEAGLQRGSIEGQVPAGVLYTISSYPVPLKRNLPERAVQLDDNVLVVNISRLDTKCIGQDSTIA